MSTVLPRTGSAEDDVDALRGRLREAQALLFAIEAGELLSDLPPLGPAREQHCAGVSLLELVTREVDHAIAELDDAKPARSVR